ncbi:hypothetical protein N0V86_003312 [Didymella sp. IMI 355093]|nr:hypothetical protein N0V86_003312 [Didymella sp. IMI 355093]
MSGIEVAGLVFGVLPILIEVVKSYEDITKKVRTLRHYSKEVKSTSEQLKVHNGIFLNEVRLLLRSIEAEEDVEIMLGNAADQRWISKNLDDKLRNVLRDSFEICCGIIEETKDTIETMREELRKFDILVDQKMKGNQDLTEPPDQTLPPDFDLCQAKNICDYLQKQRQIATQKAAKHCIGYLETPQLYKHLFYFHDRAGNSGSTQAQIENVYSLFDVMRHDPDDTMEVEDQLRLALTTATALLQFNDTPWLSERWRLRDLSYFGSSNMLDDSALKTLHLSSQISTPTATAASDNSMDGIEANNAVSDQVRYGINNTTLFFLGVALLEIAHWKPIEEKMTARDLNNEVFAARRLAAGRAPLGPQYQKIAEKCLQCNFGFGTNLRSKRLQTAVYNDVVCELESMIEKLTI